VAVNLPAAERERIREATRRLRESGLPVRWAEPAGWHLTLKFLGEVTAGLVEGLATAVGAIAGRHRPFPLRLRGAGAFPNPRRPAVWWVGVEPSEALAGLREDVERTIGPLGFPTEERPFAPHLTLGRTAREARPGALAGAESLLQAVALDLTITVEALDLMHSQLSHRGARYECVRSAVLRP